MYSRSTKKVSSPEAVDHREPPAASPGSGARAAVWGQVGSRRAAQLATDGLAGSARSFKMPQCTFF